MTNTVDSALLAAELEVLTRRARLAIPEDRRAELLVAFADLRAEIARLHEGLKPEIEPAAIYRPAVPGASE